MIRAKCVAVIALSFTSLSALAVETTYQFESIGKISYQGGTLGTTITGVLVNDTVPTTVSMPNAVSGDGQGFRCNNLITDTLKNPGLYILSVTIDVIVNPPPGSTVTLLTRCSLELAP